MLIKPTKILGIIHRSFDFIDESIFVMLFKSLVCPHLEYATTIWSTLYKKDQIAIENIQRSGTRMIREIRRLSYSERLRTLGLPSLQYRRWRTDLNQVYRILHGIDRIDAGKFFEMSGTGTRGHSLKLYKKSVRLDIKKYSFSTRVVDAWNNLADSVVSAESLNVFKSRLNKQYKDHSVKFEPDYY